MASVHDVAAFILQKQSPMTAMKLQKLVYYSQAWHLVWEERPLFTAPIEAWANGPVVRELYQEYKGQFRVSKATRGNPKSLDSEEISSINAVLNYYGPMSAHDLSELTHRENPWKDARRGLPAGVRSEAVISLTSMAEYYDSLTVAATD